MTKLKQYYTNLLIHTVMGDKIQEQRKCAPAWFVRTRGSKDSLILHYLSLLFHEIPNNNGFCFQCS
jgi:hypothetical protein